MSTLVLLREVERPVVIEVAAGAQGAQSQDRLCAGVPERPFDTDLVIPMIVSKEFRVRLDTNTYSVPFEFVGKSVFLRADDRTVRVLCDGVEIARHVRSWDRRRHVEDPAHAQKLLDRRKAAPGGSSPEPASVNA
jgi:hypothetical protein